MPNPDYNKQVGNGYSKKGGAQGWKYHKSSGKSESGPAKKDTVTGWPKSASGGDGSNFNRAAKFPHVKTRVVSENID